MQDNYLPLDEIPPGWHLDMLRENFKGDKYRCELFRQKIAGNDGPISALGFGPTIGTALRAAIAKTGAR